MTSTSVPYRNKQFCPRYNDKNRKRKHEENIRKCSFHSISFDRRYLLAFDDSHSNLASDFRVQPEQFQRASKMFDSVNDVVANFFEYQSGKDDFLHRAQNHRPILITRHVNIGRVIEKSLFHFSRKGADMGTDFRPEGDFLARLAIFRFW